MRPHRWCIFCTSPVGPEHSGDCSSFAKKNDPRFIPSEEESNHGLDQNET